MSGTIYLATTDVAIEKVDPPGRKVMLERDEILDPRHHPEHAIEVAVEQGVVAIVSPAEAEQATARLAQRWAGTNSPGAITDDGPISDRYVPVHRGAASPSAAKCALEGSTSARARGDAFCSRPRAAASFRLEGNL